MTLEDDTSRGTPSFVVFSLFVSRSLAAVDFSFDYLEPLAHMFFAPSVESFDAHPALKKSRQEGAPRDALKMPLPSPTKVLRGRLRLIAASREHNYSNTGKKWSQKVSKKKPKSGARS